MAAAEDGMCVTAGSPEAVTQFVEEQYLKQAGWEHAATEADGCDSWHLPDALRKDLPEFVSRTQRYWDRAEAHALQQRIDSVKGIENYVTKQQRDQVPDLVSPWQPITSPIAIKHLGKLLEELGETTAAVSRCLIQGVDEKEPVTGKLNRDWLEEELADLEANIRLVRQQFELDPRLQRVQRKVAQLQQWHGMLADKPPDDGVTHEILLTEAILQHRVNFLTIVSDYTTAYGQMPTKLVVPAIFVPFMYHWAGNGSQGSFDKVIEDQTAWFLSQHKIALTVRPQGDPIKYAVLS